MICVHWTLDALLEVLAAASPEIYAAREPGAGEFLIEAARRLQSQPQADDLMLWRSLSQIGAGLMNLDHFVQAQSVLHAALSALDRIKPRDLERELDTLRLLTHAQRGVAGIDAVVAVGNRIESAATSPNAPVGPAINALASAANTVSRIGDPVTKRRWLARAEAMRLLTPDLPYSGMESNPPQEGRGAAALCVDCRQRHEVARS